MDTAQNRRRGRTLDEAILDAAWAELVAHGYAAMTLEAVAKRAGTSRPVLSRRWPSRLKLATAALTRIFALNPIEIPDLGNLGAELSLLLRRMGERLPPNLIRLAFDIGSDLADANSNLAEIRAELVDGQLIRDIIARGVRRGEIDPERMTPRITALPGDLARNELLMTLKPLRDEAIREIVQDIFLPLVRRRGQ